MEGWTTYLGSAEARFIVVLGLCQVVVTFGEDKCFLLGIDINFFEKEKPFANNVDSLG